MQKKGRKERCSRPVFQKLLTPSTELKIGEAFLVRRRSSIGEPGQEEQCIATIIDIRESVGSTFLSEDMFDCCADRLRYEIREICKLMVDAVCAEATSQFDAHTFFKNREFPFALENRRYYVHYDGMDRRLDEWVGRERIIERANFVAVTPSVLSTTPLLVKVLESGTMTRSQRRIHEEFNHVQKSYDDMDATTARLEKEHAEMTKVKNIEKIRFGDYIIDAWYVSPYPAEFSRCQMLYMCEYCLAYMRTVQEYRCHKLHFCNKQQPPGDEIYRKDRLSIFEVEGKRNKAYCQCLCLLSKLFLDHKTLFFDVETFIFYVLCEVSHRGAHIVGHFSKEIASANNLACIMVLPPFQRKGYGKLLIQLSYELSLRQGLIGTPEKPLSDLGKVSYRSYWWWIILDTLDKLNIDAITISDLSEASCIAEDDIVSTLQTVQLIKYWKGDHVLRMTRRLVDHCRSVNMAHPPKLLLDPDALRWWPRYQESVL